MVEDPLLPPVFTAAVAGARGYSPSKIRRRVRAGTWRTLRRGVYCLAAVWDAATRRDRVLLAARAAVLAVGRPVVVSHGTAAVLHELPAPFRDRGLWLTAEPPGSTRYLDALTLEVAAIPAEHRVRVSGLPVTSLARTVADCLRHLDDVDACVVGDAALRRTPELLPLVAEVLQECGEWPYARRAARRLPLLDGRRESPAESWSYVAMHRQGLPLPEPQVVVHDAHGWPVGRVDAWWEEFAAVGEVDGAVKYGVGADLDREAAARALHLEKRREDALRACGATVIRWGVTDLRNEARWAALVRAQLAAADPARFRGTVSRSAPPPSLLTRSAV